MALQNFDPFQADAPAETGDLLRFSGSADLCAHLEYCLVAAPIAGGRIFSIGLCKVRLAILQNLSNVLSYF